jgi:hypothetical protein
MKYDILIKVKDSKYFDGGTISFKDHQLQRIKTGAIVGVFNLEDNRLVIADNAVILATLKLKFKNEKPFYTARYR